MEIVHRGGVRASARWAEHQPSVQLIGTNAFCFGTANLFVMEFLWGLSQMAATIWVHCIP